MKISFFSPARPRLIASNPNRLVQCSTGGHLGSHGETALDTAHQTELTTFRKPLPKNRLNNAHFISSRTQKRPVLPTAQTSRRGLRPDQIWRSVMEDISNNINNPNTRREPAPVTSTGASKDAATSPASVLKLTASQARLLAKPAIARIRLIWQSFLQIFRQRI
jgi:hypothetical protein